MLYFEPDKHYSSKRLLSRNILDNLHNELRIVDPYGGERTLDVLNNLKNKNIKFLTRVENLRDKEKERFLRELKILNLNIQIWSLEIIRIQIFTIDILSPLSMRLF